jgi:hypothetical protein
LIFHKIDDMKILGRTTFSITVALAFSSLKTVRACARRHLVEPEISMARRDLFGWKRHDSWECTKLFICDGVKPQMRANLDGSMKM